MIRGELINLRPVERTDARFVHALLNQPSVQSGWGTEGVPRSMHAVESDLEQWIESERTAGYPAALIIETLGGSAAGLMVLVCSTRYQQAMITLSLAIDAAYQRQGIGWEALTLLTVTLHDEWHIHRVQLTCEVGNTAAIALYESIGYHREATKRDATFTGGGYHDQHIYSALPGEVVL